MCLERSKDSTDDDNVATSSKEGNDGPMNTSLAMLL